MANAALNPAVSPAATMMITEITPCLSASSAPVWTLAQPADVPQAPQGERSRSDRYISAPAGHCPATDGEKTATRALLPGQAPGEQHGRHGGRQVEARDPVAHRDADARVRSV